MVKRRKSEVTENDIKQVQAIASGKLGLMPQQIKEFLIKKSQWKLKVKLCNEVSITELTMCPIISYYNRKEEHKRDVTLDSAFNFYKGNSFDSDFCRLFQRYQLRMTYSSIEDNILISGFYDWAEIDIERQVKIINEFKTTGKYYKDSDMYLEQLMFYCYCENTNFGILHYLDLGKSKWMKTEYEFTNEELNNNIFVQTLKATALRDSLYGNNIQPLIDTEIMPYTSKEKDWVCNKLPCIYKDLCMEKRK